MKRRNLFDLSHDKKLTCEMGTLVPIMCEEVLPGDKFRVNTDTLIRMAPMLAPIMQNINVYTHFFFVPNRLIWDDFESFITGGPNGNDATVHPKISLTNVATSSLADYLGVPTGVQNPLLVSALPFRAYNLIWNEWYRDENLQQEVTINTGSGVDATTSTTLLRRAWQRDYFTNALPFQQRGDAVRLGLAGDAPVVVGQKFNNTTGDMSDGTETGERAARASVLIGGSPSSMAGTVKPGTAGSWNAADYNDIYTLDADLSASDSPTINDFRRAFQVQAWLEANARGGCRYVESILTHFGIRSSDQRLQRPEYLGGGKSPIMVSEILQSSADDNQPTPLGTMAGHGVSAQRSHQFKRFFEEHGFVIGIMSIMPRSGYFQGLSKMWTRETRYDYYWPLLANLGEEAVLNKEIYAQGTADDDGVFGFQPRYQEYRKRYSSVHGDFRTSLKFWHLAREFANLPALNSAFIECRPDTRIFAVQGADAPQHFWVELYNNVKALRPIPKKGIPFSLGSRI